MLTNLQLQINLHIICRILENCTFALPPTDDSLALVRHAAALPSQYLGGNLLQQVLVVVVVISKAILVFVPDKRLLVLSAAASPGPWQRFVAAATAAAGSPNLRAEGPLRHGGLRLQPGEEAGEAVRPGDGLQPGKISVQLSDYCGRIKIW